MEAANDIVQLLDRLAGVPTRIERAIAGWSVTDLRSAPVSGEWQVADILAHLRASDDIMAPRIYMLLARDNPPLTSFDDRRWAEAAGYAQLDVRASLATFAARRAELVLALRRVSPGDWTRTGKHEQRG